MRTRTQSNMRELGKKYRNSQTHSKYGVIELYEIQSQLHYTKYMLVLPVRYYRQQSTVHCESKKKPLYVTKDETNLILLRLNQIARPRPV